VSTTSSRRTTRGCARCSAGRRPGGPERDAPMRLCVLVSTYPRISETFVYEPIRWLGGRGHEVVVLAKRAGSLPEGDDARFLAPRIASPAREAAAGLRSPVRALARLVRAGDVRVAARSLLSEIAHADVVLAH